MELSVLDAEFDSRGHGPKLRFVFRKQGFIDEVIDFVPEGEPESPRTAIPVIIVAYMRPKT